METDEEELRDRAIEVVRGLMAREGGAGGDDPVMDSKLGEAGMAIATVVEVSVSTRCGGALRGGQGERGELDWVLQH